MTMISNRPDGGTHDNPVAGTDKTWANDNFRRVATIVRGDLLRHQRILSLSRAAL
jgi:hypothetical protein